MNKSPDLLVCVPGQRLCLADESTVAGAGTYDRQGYIYSMLAGTVHIRQKDNVGSQPLFYNVLKLKFTLFVIATK